MFFLSKCSFPGVSGTISELAVKLKNTPIELNSCTYSKIQFVDANTLVLSPKMSVFLLRNSFAPKIRIEVCQEKTYFMFFLSAIERLFIFLVLSFGEIGFIAAFLSGTLADNAGFLIVLPIIIFVFSIIIFNISVKKLKKKLSEFMTQDSSMKTGQKN